MIETEDDLEHEECDCDFVQIVVDNDERFELHHVIPDDGAGHVPDPECPCRPDFDRVDYELIVIDHHDQDAALVMDDED